MRYRNLNQYIPQEKREELNEKILYCIDNDLCDKMGITKEVIYNTYTGVGGLHGKNFNDYSSFHDFTKAKQSIENGQFFTGHNESKLLIDILGINTGESVMDITCGKGDLFNFIPSNCVIYGNELDFKAYKVCKYLYPDVVLSKGDMREYNPRIKVDTVIGNPPFNLRLNHNGITKYSQRIYVEKSLELLNTGGLMALIVPKSFLDDEFHNKADIEYMNDNFNFVCQTLLDPKAFTHVGVENFETKIIVFSKKSEFIPNREFDNSYVNCNAQLIYENYIKPIRELQKKFKSNIKLENNKNYDGDKDFDDKVTKLLFDIKRTKSISHRYVECFNYYNEFYNQKCPESMKYDEWNKIRVTKDKVLKKLKNVLGGQHNRVVIKSENPYKKKLKQEREYLIQSKPFDLVEIDENIDTWLKDSIIYDSNSGENIKLNNVQREVVNKMLLKKYGFINAGMGSGKTLMSIHVAKYREWLGLIKNTLVIAPSIAINNNWSIVLNNYNIPFTIIDSIDSINKIKDNDFILVTFNMLGKYKKHIKKMLNKSISNKYQLILDESDCICNINSSRAKVTLSVCRKAKFKLLMSGTATRNDIAEIFTQLKLMYGESFNFICNCEHIYRENKDSNKLNEVYNELYSKPFPAYKKGYDLFRECFNPSKTTVFGIKDKSTQDVYNVDILKELLNKSMVVKSLEDVTGKKLYTIKQHLVSFNDSEKKLYHKAINEFYNMKYLFSSTGNPRKDKYLEIIQQLNLLLDICSQANRYKEYNSIEIPNKQKKVLELINTWDKENIAIGCRTLKEVSIYESLIRKNITNRNLYIIKGSVSMKKRKDIIEKIKSDPTGILLSTQQSLSCSMNIPFIDKVIITRLPWNFYIQQYFFRFIRYDSINEKEIHIISYENSLENNLMALIIAKEKLNNIVKNQEDTDIEENLGIDFDLVNMLLSKSKDSMGKVRINWGEQNIM